VAAFVGIVGTGSLYVGAMQALRAERPDMLGVVVEPQGCAALAGRPVTRLRHRLQGTSYGYAPPKWDPSLADLFLEVSDDEAEHARRRLAQEEGLYVGYSSGANLAAALSLIAARPDLDGDVVTVLCDTGLKYGV
jgi:cysteine synthase A